MSHALIAEDARAVRAGGLRNAAALAVTAGARQPAWSSVVLSAEAAWIVLRNVICRGGFRDKRGGVGGGSGVENKTAAVCTRCL